ncbi:hemolysin XhlA family protein [Paenibacillus contaminans]|uniref:Hemolysin XhlA n=1 Tax=Paenibacillus contaminans TaxID=450362 RepID=A0A329M9F4_9BACL|nr:hemolysin XhlA family protein [Paenibacillus contaminans]RAV16398.1 hemolysin XhlA [Paenibacillus contaminans]
MTNDDKNEILQRLTRMETKSDIMGNVREVANEASQSANSANKRIDELADNQRWLWRTVIGALIIGAIGLLLKWKG